MKAKNVSKKLQLNNISNSSSTKNQSFRKTENTRKRNKEVSKNFWFEIKSGKKKEGKKEIRKTIARLLFADVFAGRLDNCECWGALWFGLFQSVPLLVVGRCCRDTGQTLEVGKTMGEKCIGRRHIEWQPRSNAPPRRSGARADPESPVPAVTPEQFAWTHCTDHDSWRRPCRSCVRVANRLKNPVRGGVDVLGEAERERSQASGTL